MNLSLDYDDTYTRDPKLWNHFVVLARAAGHKVYVVTLRRPDEGGPVKEALENKVDGIFFCSYAAKSKYMYEQGINIHVWIDDMPRVIYEGL